MFAARRLNALAISSKARFLSPVDVFARTRDASRASRANFSTFIELRRRCYPQGVSEELLSTTVPSSTSVDNR
jgi:hypothetical protein